MRHLYITLIALFLATTSFATGTVGPILGTPVICGGGVTYLSDTTAGGTWSSGMTSIATVGGTSGIVVGMAPGTSTISYTVGGTTVTQVVTINPTPTPIGGVATVCVGSTTVLTDGVAGGVWSSATPSIATVNMAGIVTGIFAGTTTISYTIPTGCAASIVVTVEPAPSPITGITSLCVGGYDTLTSTPGGGTWSGVPSTVLLVYPTGVLYGVSAGVATITYASAAGCYATLTVTVTATTTPILGTLSVCAGSSTSLTDAVSGGTWASSSSGVATIGASSGVATGIAGGTDIITYTFPAGCIATAVLTVNTVPPGITGPTTVCVGSLITLMDAAGGGIWMSANLLVGSIGSASGVLTGISAGVVDITYELPTGCFTPAYAVTVNDAPSVSISASPGTTFCTGTTVSFNATITGGTGSSDIWLVNGVLAGTGDTYGYTPSAGDSVLFVFRGTSFCSGTPDTIYQGVTHLVVNPLPTITATSTANCGGTYNFNGSGAGAGGNYTWSPASGLSCITCAATVAAASAGGVTFTVTGTDVNNCTNTGTVTLNGDRISGYISLTATPTDTLKVWLIQFNPIDSSLTGEDSMLTCMDSGTPYYEFDGKPAGSYLVKARLLSSVPGTSGYVPTYGLSSSTWDMASTLTHTSAVTDTQHINMIYGTVPSGPGFIGGLISAGAGRNTSGAVPAVGMLVYLKNASGAILTYTYTDATGRYSFSGLANASYTIYPVDYHYYTTPWVGVTLSTTSETDTTISFYEHTSSRTITPESSLNTQQIVSATNINVYPNPAINELNINWEDQQTGNAGVTITDITGREVYSDVFNIGTASGKAQIDIHSLNDGIYFITIRSGSIYYMNKLLVQR